MSQYVAICRNMSQYVSKCLKMDDGSCTDHHLSNAMKHAVHAFDPDIERALVNIYMDVGGAPGRELKREKHFEKVCLDIGLAPIRSSVLPASVV